MTYDYDKKQSIEVMNRIDDAVEKHKEQKKIDGVGITTNKNIQKIAGCQRNLRLNKQKALTNKQLEMADNITSSVLDKSPIRNSKSIQPKKKIPANKPKKPVINLNERRLDKSDKIKSYIEKYKEANDESR